MKEHTLRFSEEPSSFAPRRARTELSQWLDGVECPAQRKEDLLLAISELVTNAVVHAGSRCDVVATFTDGRLRLEVHDQHHGPPIERTPDGHTGGYGLRLVAAVVDSWGWLPTATGKLVWTETLC